MFQFFPDSYGSGLKAYRVSAGSHDRIAFQLVGHSAYASQSLDELTWQFVPGIFPIIIHGIAPFLVKGFAHLVAIAA